MKESTATGQWEPPVHKIMGISLKGFPEWRGAYGGKDVISDRDLGRSCFFIAFFRRVLQSSSKESTSKDYSHDAS